MPVSRKTIVMRARELRKNKNMTPAEQKLWCCFLSRLQWKFRKQAPCGYYILDFYCIPLSLAIEVDGDQHYTPEGLIYDQARSRFLEASGICVLRFTNQQILDHFDMVCEQIRQEYASCTPQYRKKDIPLLYGQDDFPGE